MADNASGHICESYQESLETADDYIDPKKALTKREFQVAHLLTQGNSVKEVAAELNITYKTVDTMKTSAMKKLGVNKVTQLVRLFSEESYVQTSNGHGTGWTQPLGRRHPWFCPFLNQNETMVCSMTPQSDLDFSS